jgi:hypothetical protein
MIAADVARRCRRPCAAIMIGIELSAGLQPPHR